MVNKIECFLCYFDILGFENRAKGIVETYDLDVEPSYIRNKLRRRIKNKLKELEESNYVIGISNGRDDWVIVTDELQKLIISVYEIIEIQPDFPFEIGLGSEVYREDVNFNSDSFIDEDSTIKFLKNDIIGEYCKLYRATHDDESVKSTFILFTENLFQRLDYCDQESFNPQKYRKKELYYIYTESFKRWAKSLNFLNTLGIPRDPIYEGIDKLYVVPKEYNEIKKSLEYNKVVIITGNPEFGKTFTAVRLLWEYYLKGYQPIWEKGESSLYEKKNRFEKIESELKEKQIFYFEDPFGEKEYERTEFPGKKIKAIINKIREYDNIYLIITSRSEIFQNFNLRNYLFELDKFEQRLSTKNNFQEYKGRENLLLAWAKKNRCRWLFNIELKAYVLELLKSPTNLPSPLRIRDFCVASCNTTDSAILGEKIIEKSKDTPICFADEISTFSADKILFLSFPFTSGSFKLEFVEEKYSEMVQEFGIKNALIFASVFKWFRSDKIEVFNDLIQFSHPSYLQALKYLLETKECSTTIFPEIFSKFLCKLAEDKNAAGYVSRVIADNYNQLPKETHSLFFTLAENDNSKKSVARTLVYNYSNLPKEVQALLHDLYLEADIKIEIARAITDYFNVVPEELKTLFFDISRDDKFAGHLARSIACNYNNLPEDAKNLIFEIYGKGKFEKEISYAIVENYENLPDHIKCLLFKMLEQEVSRPHIAKAVADTHGTLPASVLEYILIKLSKDKNCEKFVSKAIIKNFDRVPENIRNILFGYIENSQNIEYITQSVEGNFSRLPEETSMKILSKFAVNEKTTKHAVRILIRNFDISSISLRTLLSELIKSSNNVKKYALNYVEKKPNRISDSTYHEIKQYLL
ncbi:hypothetical protein MSSAC_2227 [Methanosarcina siciliae C2J]|uniref:Novel STAND NTPase 3 domain-containing protein n=1 Tax=Methanosarcina siciliae C2J TaxID=1434118 RepID=A0A0E3PPB6_9EURY|nr:hypothetical protein [Methanosarcina siciliae]AKB36817.1 hypothetical protein MSSAC_2227 [Methanosarcina siciliae C2J]